MSISVEKKIIYGNKCCSDTTHIQFMLFLLDAKAAEAAQSAYYDPNRPQMAYVPPPAYYVSITSFTYLN